MKNKVLALAGCIAAIAPTTSIANVLPENLVGLNLGEIRSSSFLNQPFKGVIPFLFTSYENSKNLRVRLASESIFNKIGAEKLPILNSLNFQVAQQNNKPVILISSDQPIGLPFLNFVLEIQGPEGAVYQDYTVLLDPESKQVTSPQAEYIAVNPYDSQESYVQSNQQNIKQQITLSNEQIKATEQLLKGSGTLLLANLSSETLTTSKQKLKYRVKTGDSLFKIAQSQDTNNASMKTMSRLIYQKNPSAFVSGDLNRIKKGALLNLPTTAEINGFELARKRLANNKTISASAQKAVNQNTEISTAALSTKEKNETEKSADTVGQNTYTVAKGDSLSKITQKFASKNISFTKMMNAIYKNNPDAFVNKSKNKIKAGAELNIPVIAQTNLESKQDVAVKNSTDKSITDNKTDQPNTKQSLAKAENKGIPTKTLISDVKTDIEKQDITEPVEVEVSFSADRYQVQEGDNLSIIAKKIGYEEVPFAKMLKAIYIQNPEAFVDGSMAKLSVGAVLTLPTLKSFEIESKASSVQVTTPAETNISQESAKISADKALKNSNAPSTDLIKRIRELRKELRQSQDSLSEMKGRLSDKELLLQQKNIQLEILNTSITKVNDIAAPKVIPVLSNSVMDDMKLAEESIYRPKSNAEIAKLKRDLLNKQRDTNKQLKMAEESEKDKELEVSEEQVTTAAEFRAYKVNLSKIEQNEVSSSFNEFVSNNYAYLTLSLLLGLLLVRYRRELYSYTYSTINYDQPTYYPIPDSDKYDLKEKNITFHDPKMDEESYRYESLTPDNSQKVSAEHEHADLVIDQTLVEATVEDFIDIAEGKKKNNFESSNFGNIDDESNDVDKHSDDSNEFGNKENAKQIEHCEHLVTELFDDLSIDEDATDNGEWNNIEKVCDNYIEKIKDSENDLSTTKDGALVDGVTDFNHMMTDLLESLEKVDESVKRNNLIDQSFPNLFIKNKDKPNVKRDKA